MFEVGAVVTLSVSPLDGDGNAVDVTGLALVVTRPDGTTVNVSPLSHPGVGSYSAAYTTTLPGRHVARWAGTGFAETEVFNLWPTDPRFLFNLDDARAAVGYIAPDRGEQVRLYVAATTYVIEDIVGPVVPTPRVETFDGEVAAFILRDQNVTVTSVAQNGTTLTADIDYTVSSDAGIVYAGRRDSARRFSSGDVTVTYTTGLPQVPANIMLAAIEEFRFLWQQGQQGNRPGFGSDPDTEAWTPSGFAVPRRVIELCGKERRKAWRPA